MGISKITRNFQLTIPKDVRSLRQFKIGDTVLFVVEGERVDLVKMGKGMVKKIAGLWSSRESGVEYENKLRRGWQKRRVL